MKTQVKFEKTGIEGAWLVHSTQLSDNRGAFREWFRYQNNLEITGSSFNVMQSNFSISNKGVIRGIHYSLNPIGQWKWVTCLAGSIFDVVVDIRPKSPTFGKVECLELSPENGTGVLIQANLGHAFQAKTDNSIVVYNITSEYNPEFEHEINPLDLELKIQWPMKKMILSRKDESAPSLNELKNSNLLPRDFF